VHVGFYAIFARDNTPRKALPPPLLTTIADFETAAALFKDRRSLFADAGTDANAPRLYET
jgi:hypothetical protein